MNAGRSAPSLLAVFHKMVSGRAIPSISVFPMLTVKKSVRPRTNLFAWSPHMIGAPRFVLRPDSGASFGALPSLRATRRSLPARAYS